MSAPIIRLFLSLPLPTSNGRADLRRASMAQVPDGATVLVESNEAKHFDPTHVGLFAAALSPAGELHLNGADANFLINLRIALLNAWESGR